MQTLLSMSKITALLHLAHREGYDDQQHNHTKALWLSSRYGCTTPWHA
jgi:hypothetical protein